MDNKTYWESYYANHYKPFGSSLFAEFVLKNLNKKDKLVELGCGNGRDSMYFNKNGIDVTSYDQCNTEINYLSTNYQSESIRFYSGDFTRINTKNKYNAIYSRFTIHSVNVDGENRILDWVKDVLLDDGKLFIEVRSDKDPHFGIGEKVGENEYVNTHYRRFLNFEDFKRKLIELGFELIYAEESNGFAPHTSEDPICIRIIAKIK